MKTITSAAAAVTAALVLAGCSSSSASQPSAAGSTPPSAPAAAHHPASAAALAARLKAAGLPVRHLIVYTAATDPNHEMGRQGGYTSKVAWVDPRAIKAGAGNPASDRGGTEFGGGIEVFPTTASARARYEYLRGFQPPLGDGYDYLSGTAILRLSQYLTPAQARTYKAAFSAAVQD
jgi:hypothetical protein